MSIFSVANKVKKVPKATKRLLQSKILETNFGCHICDLMVADNTLFESLDDYRYMYIDVSIFAKNDNKTGIQRVVREVIFQLLHDKEVESKIKFVVATKNVAYREVKCQFINDKLVFDIIGKNNKIIEPTKDDILIGLDFCPHLIPHHLFTLIRWKKEGVKFAWVLYDMLPLYHPEWFADTIQQTYRPWLNTILLVADVVLCISKTVKNQVQVYAQELGLECRLATIHLGYGFRGQRGIEYYDSTGLLIREQLKNKSFVLMVSTLEPRKGYTDIISALNNIWDKQESDVSLVIVGKQGWKVEGLMQLICIPKHKNKIYWLSSVDDELLISLYQESLGIIVASHDEGYGLPLVEAIAHNKHLLIRDTEIFREVSQGYHNISYFAKNGVDLEISLKNWLNDTVHQPVQKNTLIDDGNKGWEITLQDIKNSIIRN